MIIYTDGSGINEQVGVVAYNKQLDTTSYQHLGRQIQYNVYSAELIALDLAIT
jgi:hypothetical protein